jgi:hypothetical protein
MCTCCDIKEPRILPGSVCTYVFHTNLTLTANHIIFLNIINRLVFIRDADCAVCGVGTEFLYAIRRTSVFKDSSAMSVLDYIISA